MEVPQVSLPEMEGLLFPQARVIGTCGAFHAVSKMGREDGLRKTTKLQNASQKVLKETEQNGVSGRKLFTDYTF